MWIPWDSCSTVTVRVLAVGDVDEHGEPARPSGVAHAGAAVAGRARDNRRVVRRESSRVLRQHPDRGEACRGGIRPRTGTQPRTRSRTRLGRARRLGYTRRESPRRYWCTRGEGTGRRSADGLDRRIRPTATTPPSSVATSYGRLSLAVVCPSPVAARSNTGTTQAKRHGAGLVTRSDDRPGRRTTSAALNGRHRRFPGTKIEHATDANDADDRRLEPEDPDPAQTGGHSTAPLPDRRQTARPAQPKSLQDPVVKLRVRTAISARTKRACTSSRTPVAPGCRTC